MKKKYLIHNKKNSFWLLTLMLFFIIGGSFVAEAQVKPFTPRTSQYSPTQDNYRLKGDFTMLGNLNLNVVNSSSTDNSAAMKYVDVDSDSNTVNSSTADLEYIVENPECSEVIFAGLYWTGRAHNNDSPMEFLIDGTANNRFNGNTFNGYNLTITAQNDSSSNTTGSERQIATYTFTPTGGGNNTVFRFYTWRTGYIFYNYYSLVTVQVGTGPVNTLSGAYDSSSNAKFTFSQTYNLLTNIQLKSLGKRRTNNAINNNFYAEVISGAKLLNKRKVKLKGPGATTYENVLASSQDILFPSGSSENMFVGYAEVTDYVRDHGAGTYAVADIAAIAGTSGSGTPGFYAGWSMVVIYENAEMTWKDISVYDGFAFMESEGGAKELQISGFNALPSGPVNVKIGVMAGEGDLMASGDYFQMKRQSDGQFERLSHDLNDTNNFFNSSIFTGGNARNPNVVNNMGMDISMFNLDNTNKRFITNNQTSTTFRYGTSSDTYVIPLIILGIEAFIPEPEAIQVLTVPTTSLEPGEEMQMNVEIRNNGDEAISNLLVDIPVPFGMEFVSVQGVRLGGLTGPPPFLYTGPGGNKIIRWEFGNLPLLAGKPLQGTLTYKLKVTEDCQILANAQCALNPEFIGKMSGKGVTSQVDFSNFPFIQGYEEAGACVGLPISAPIEIDINSGAYVDANCGGISPIQILSFCNPGATIPFVDIIGNFPAGSRFYNEFPVTENSIEYTLSSGFPSPLGENTYYAVPANSVNCYFEFIIDIAAQCDCIGVIEGGIWNQSFSRAQVAAMPTKIITSYDPLTVAGTNAGMFFDIYRLDNSFNLKINGVPIVLDPTASNEMQFDIGTPAARMNNVRFLDGGLYGVDADPIWKIIGTAGKPAVRVEVSSEGKVTLYGRKVTDGPLYELRLFNGAVLNTVQWYDNANNIIEVTQDAYGTTRLHGTVYGENICEDGLYVLTKTAIFNGNTPAQVDDVITYTFQVKNIADENIYDVVLVDPLLDGEITTPPTGDVNNNNILDINETWTYTVDYSITAEDIARQGVYNLATVFGRDRNNNPIPTIKSFDSNNPGGTGNPDCETCTFTPLTADCDVIFPIVSDDPFYWLYNYSTYRGGQPDETNSGTVVGTNDGFEFDIYRLDNSFNMIINGVKLFDDEIQLDAKLTPGVNMKFVGGGEYGKNGIPRILSLRGNQDNPMLRVRISANGTVQLFGSKTSYGPLLELEPKVGSFNIIPWNMDPNQLNTITVTQEVWWKTVFDGYGYGLQDNCNSGKPGDDDASENDGEIYTAKYYPNPVSAILNVQANTTIQEIEIYNLLGQRVINLKPNASITEINMANLQAAVYMMKITLNGKVETYRVIKE